MHFDVYETTWFKLGMMIDTLILYILIPVLLTLTLFQGYRSVELTLLMWILSPQKS